VPQLDMIDETFVVAEPAALAAVLHDPGRWRRWWPELELSVFADRGVQGVRWNVTGALAGSMEVWLEPFGDGVILHYYLRADPAGAPYRSVHRVVAEASRRQRATKRVFWALKDELEGGRRPGEPRAAAAVTSAAVTGAAAVTSDSVASVPAHGESAEGRGGS
jgi:hypothetical protein